MIEGDKTMDINGISFEFIQIPGHTPGSMAIKLLFDGKTMLFTGDALQPDGLFLENISLGWQGDPNFNHLSIVESMKKFMQYETDMILPGHGKVCLRNGTKVLLQAAQTAFTTMR
jgi:glyoxylase-like metal-dependent hydrolase (beta-lactamase superfamily II)